MPRNESRRWLGLSLAAWGGVAVGAGLLGGLVFHLIHLGPKAVEFPAGPTAMSADQWRLSAEIDAVEQRYRRRPADVPLPAGWADELAQAIAWQEHVLRNRQQSDPAQTQRLERLQMIRDTLRARQIWPQVVAAEAQLQEDLAPERRAVVLEQLLARRRQINRSQAAARYKDLVKETRLARELEAAQAEPLRAVAAVEVDRARAASARQDWPVALEHYTRAREVLDDLNLRFSRTRFADLSLQSQVRAEEAALQGAPQAAEVEVYTQGGDAAAAAGRVEEAADRYCHAMELQAQLNERWPHSRFVSTTRLDQLEEKRQTVLSGAVIAAMRVEDRAVGALLARRQTLAASDRIVAVQVLAERLAKDFPKSRRGDGGLTRKYAFLATLGGTLRELQDEVYDRLVPLPGSDHLLLLRTEAPQELYTRIMKINPSRRPGPQAPVDSVTWSEAAEFCHRLGWVLGQTVRLPTATEFGQALGDTLVEKRRGDAADGTGQLPVAGYRNLRDGVAEWLAAAPDATEAAVATAATGHDGADLAGVFSPLPKDTRTRAVGFRVLVETTLR